MRLYCLSTRLLGLSVIFLALCIATTFINADTAQAQGVQLRPLLYHEFVEAGEKKKGFVDVSNPTNSPLKLRTEVQSFKQVDAEGKLEFFDLEYLDEGVKPDLEEFTLGPKEALRLYFLVDSAKLPPGDVFAALFVKSVADESIGVAQSVRAGTLMILENGEGGPRDAALSELDVGFLQVGEQISGSVKVKNAADPDKSTAFFPEITLALGPWFVQGTTHEGPLVFAGIERTIDFMLPSNHFGPYELTVSAHGAEVSQWIFLVTGWWRWVVLSVGLALLAALAVWLKMRRRFVR